MTEGEIEKEDVRVSCGHGRAAIKTTKTLGRTGGVGSAGIPELELAVPPARHNQIGRLEESYGLDGGIVDADLLRDVVAGRLAELPHPDGIVDSARKHGRPVRREARGEDGGLVLVVHW